MSEARPQPPSALCRRCEIPASNVMHLILRADVVEAPEKGLFRVWPVETVDEAVELLTGAAPRSRATGLR